MAASKGRNLLIKKGAVVICAGILSKDIKFNGEAIDITSDDDSGWRSLLSEAGVMSIDVSFEGVTKDAVLRTLAVTTSRMLTDVTLVFPNGDIVDGDFFLSAYSEKGETNDAIKFSAELQSSGVMVYTPDV